MGEDAPLPCLLQQRDEHRVCQGEMHPCSHADTPASARGHSARFRCARLLPEAQGIPRGTAHLAPHPLPLRAPTEQRYRLPKPIPVRARGLEEVMKRSRGGTAELPGGKRRQRGRAQVRARLWASAPLGEPGPGREGAQSRPGPPCGLRAEGRASPEAVLQPPGLLEEPEGNGMAATALLQPASAPLHHI